MGMVDELRQKYPSLFPATGGAFDTRLQNAFGGSNPVTNFAQHPINSLNAIGNDPDMPGLVAGPASVIASGLSLPGKAYDYAANASEPVVDRASMIVAGASKNDMADYATMKAQELAAANKPADDTAARQNSAANGFSSSLASGLMGDASGGAAAIPIGQVPAGMYDAPNLPLPTPDMKPDYSRVRNLVDQMRPEAVDTKSFDDTKGMAILAGVAAGLLGSDGNIGDQLLRMGLGAAAGVATVDQAKLEAQEKFKAASRQYLADAINVETHAAGADADFAGKVFEAQTNRAIAGYKASQERKESMRPSLVQAGDKLFIKATDANGAMTLKPITDSPTLRFDRVSKTLRGLGMDEKEADATAIQAAAGDDPSTMLPTMALGLMHKRGQVESLWKDILASGDGGKQLKAKYDQIGVGLVTDPTANGDKAKDEAQAGKDMLLIHTLQGSPYLMSQAMKYAGLPSTWTSAFDATVRGK